MKRKTLITAIFLGTVLSLFISACKIYYKPEKIDYEVTANAAQLKEGKKLVTSICFPCHFNPSTNKLTGKRLVDVPEFAGKVYSGNITRDPEKGIADYTNGELAYLFRTGISKNGKLMPYMRKPRLADVDVKAIIAFLRSDDDLVIPSKQEYPESKYSAFGKFGLRRFSGPLKYPENGISKPDISDKAEYGRYLVFNLGCFHCHSASSIRVNEKEPEKTKGYMGGGNKVKDDKGNMVITPNLTFDETGIKNWKEDDLRKALKEGRAEGGRPLREPMPIFSLLSDEETAAIYAYLQTIPKIKGKTGHH